MSGGLELAGWQWHRKGEPWGPLLDYEPQVTSEGTERRALYAGPVTGFLPSAPPPADGQGNVLLPLLPSAAEVQLEALRQACMQLLEQCTPRQREEFYDKHAGMCVGGAPVVSPQELPAAHETLRRTVLANRAFGYEVDAIHWRERARWQGGS